MEKFRSGNIIKNPYGQIEVFVKYYTDNNGKKMFNTVSFQFEGSTSHNHVETHERTVECPCHFDNWVDLDNLDEGTQAKEDCPDCHGKGEYVTTVFGEECYIKLASTGKEYLEKLLNGALSELKK